VAGVIFFNNVGMLHMCGHGTIGVIATLAHLGRIHPGEHRLETPVGIIRTILHEDGTVSLDNVASYRKAHNVVLEIPDFGRFCGDVAWGGNWFFLVQYQHCPITLVHIDELMTVTRKIRHAINSQGYPEVDHIELVGPPASTGANARNFVLCPGHAYDRSPCGTGTSAKLACLAADGKLAEGESWVQESVIGSRFTGSYRWRDRSAGVIVPTITGRAYVNAEAHLLLNPDDPFCWGIGDGSTSDGLVRVG
jgi:proline racemase